MYPNLVESDQDHQLANTLIQIKKNNPKNGMKVTKEVLPSKSYCVCKENQCIMSFRNRAFVNYFVHKKTKDLENVKMQIQELILKLQALSN